MITLRSLVFVLVVGQGVLAFVAPPLPSYIVETEAIRPKLKDYQEGVKIEGRAESKVTITVGEKNGFQYTLSGYTNSVEKIAVSGEYYNDEATNYGYARLFMVVDSGVAYYALRPHGKILDVYVENYRYDQFYFQIIAPHPVSAYDLHEGQINATAVLVTGPSRSSILYPRIHSVGLAPAPLEPYEHGGEQAQQSLESQPN